MNTPGKRRFVIAVRVAAVFILVLLTAEVALRIQQQSVAISNRLDSGMILYDAEVGWKLAPGWHGGHRHTDFDVHYTIGSTGFRGEFGHSPNGAGRRIAVVGDSYTFGLGVEDEETFPAILTARNIEGNVFLNFGVPAYSTDQEYLLIRERVLDFSPDLVLLVVCLPNDLLDNELPFALQTNRAKPYFEIDPQGLVRRHAPVPFAIKPDGYPGPDPVQAVFGDVSRQTAVLSRLLRRSVLYRTLAGPLTASSIANAPRHLRERFRSALMLFEKLINRIHVVVAQHDAEFHIVLLPGRSLVEHPNSLSALCQNFERNEIIAMGHRNGFRVIDLAGLLAERYRERPGKWFHSSEGHFTREGHETVAEILLEELLERQP